MADGNLGPLEWAENRKEGVAPVEKPHYPCPAFNGNPVVQSACVRVSAQPVGNRTYCVANNCQSPWRVTLAPGTVAPAPRAPVVARAPATPPPTRVTLETTTAIPRAVIDYQVVDGERRWISCKMAGVSTLLGIIYDGLSVDDVRRRSGRKPAK
jgi:hypothetical protein